MADNKIFNFFPKMYKAGINPMITAILEVMSEADEDVKASILEAGNQLFVTLAEDKFLEKLGNNKGVEKPPADILNLRDSDFRKLIPVLSTFPKQVKTTIQDLLDVFWGPLYSRANTTGSNPEAYDLGPINTLTGMVTMTNDSLAVYGSGTQFTTEINPGDYIKAQTQDNEYFVKVTRIINDTSLTVASKYEGTAFTGAAAIYTPKTLKITHENGTENIDISPAFIADTENATAIEVSNAINNQSRNFTSETLKDAFAQEIIINLRTNTAGPLGFIQVESGSLIPIVGFSTDKTTIQDLALKTAIYEIKSREIIIRIPSGVPAVRRDLKGTIHIHGNYEGYVTSVDNGNKTIAVNFDNYVTNNFHQNQKFSQNKQEFIVQSHPQGTNGIILQFDDTADLSDIIIGKRFAILDIKRDNPFIGTFIYDTENTSFTINRKRTILNQTIEEGKIYPQIVVDDGSDIPDEPGVLIFNFGRGNQEQSVKYLSRPNNSTLLLDPTYTFSTNHYVGEFINIITQEVPVPSTTGDDYATYIVGVDEARQKIMELIRQIKAAGVVVRFIVEEPDYLFEGC